jgi:hypothetical protein
MLGVDDPSPAVVARRAAPKASVTGGIEGTAQPLWRWPATLLPSASSSSGALMAGRQVPILVTRSPGRPRAHGRRISHRLYTAARLQAGERADDVIDDHVALVERSFDAR